jgi:hypothetical protein
LGSNQVDFVGMTWFASATAINASMLQCFHASRIECECDLHFAAVDAPFKFFQAANAADEINTLIGALIRNAKQWPEEVILKEADVQTRHRII